MGPDNWNVYLYPVVELARWGSLFTPDSTFKFLTANQKYYKYDLLACLELLPILSGRVSNNLSEDAPDLSYKYYQQD